ncbi:MAG: Hsp20 family protein [Campylobacter sp.]|nr:Hsp20 family protein [Campylobacter sp.]
MAGKYFITKNVNGNVTHKSGEFNDDISFDDIVNSMFTSTFDDFFNTPLLENYMSKSPARFLKSESNVAFPPHSKFVKPKEDKTLHYEVGLCGISKKDVKVDIDDDKIIIRVKKDIDESGRVYSYKGLKRPTDETLVLNFDPKLYDVNTTNIKLEDGLLEISMEPREELKPIRKSLFGDLLIEDKSSESSEDENK